MCMFVIFKEVNIHHSYLPTLDKTLKIWLFNTFCNCEGIEITFSVCSTLCCYGEYGSVLCINKFQDTGILKETDINVCVKQNKYGVCVRVQFIEKKVLV